MMSGFGAYLLKKTGYGVEPEIAAIGPVMENMFGLEGWQQTKQIEPLIPEYYFPDLQVAVARDRAGTTDGFFFAAKGGHNDEQHNHNDIGTCIVFYNGIPVLVDAGVGTYTKDTFSELRYTIWTMQSKYHNLPLINGIPQKDGRKYAARNSKFTASKSKVTFSTDIVGAYPEEAKVEKWERAYTLERGKKITISDKFRLKEVAGGTQLNFMTPLQPTIKTDGILELKGAEFTMLLKYDAKKLSAGIEKKEINDEKLTKIWGNELSVIVFEVADIISGDITIDVVNAR